MSPRSTGTTSLCLRTRRLGSSLTYPHPLDTGNPSIFFVSRDDWETLPDEIWGDIPRLLCQWKALSLGASFLRKSIFTF